MNNNHVNQIDRDTAFYISGFSDGEGSFNVSFRKRDDYLIGWKMSPVFNISQKEKSILALIKNHLGCGTIRFRKDNVWVFEVDNRKALINTIIPFFSRYPFLSDKKKKDFNRFKEYIKIIYQGNKSKTLSDVENVLHLLSTLDSTHSRKYTDDDIRSRARQFSQKNSDKIEKINNLSLLDFESSETTRQTGEIIEFS